MQRFKDRVVMVSGSAQGLGRAIAERLAQEGATLVAVDINAEGAEATAKALGGGAFAVTCDIGDPDQVAALHRTVEERCGKLDVQVNAGAIVPFVPWDELTFEEWCRVRRVNLDGVFLMCKAGSDLMRKGGYGRIVNIASNSLFAGTPNMAHYVSAKGGVLAFSRALATELGQHAITVNAVAPGLIDTEGTQASPHKEAFDFVEMLQAIKGRGVPKLIVPAVAFLASEEAEWITGQCLVSDAGMVRW